MLRPLAPLIVLALSLPLTGCRNGGDDKESPGAAARSDGGGGTSTGAAAPRGASSPSAATRSAATQPTEFTGTLRGDVAAIGGETTGWRLEGDAQTGGIDVDVSKVQQRAKSLDGQRVSVTGKMTTRSWPERGETQVLVAEKIEPAPLKQ